MVKSLLELLKEENEVAKLLEKEKLERAKVDFMKDDEFATPSMKEEYIKTRDTVILNRERNLNEVRDELAEYLCDLEDRAAECRKKRGEK